MDVSSTTLARTSATTGTNPQGARTNPHTTSTNAPDVERRLTELRNVVLLRRLRPVTLLVAEQWEEDLRAACLLSKYSLIPLSIKQGAHASIPQILRTSTPLNRDSTETLPHIFLDIIQSKFNKGRYLGPFSPEELKLEIGPFQSSPLSLIPKSGKPGKYCLIQNVSFPHTNTPYPSINSFLELDDFPCTWGMFTTISTLIRKLPTGAQAAVRDISEAYWIIPLHESQWARTVVRIAKKPDLFALNMCNSFGCTTAGGLFGMFGDALADLLRAKGIGPVLKWVDDFIFFRIPGDCIPAYNQNRECDCKVVDRNGGLI